MFIYKDVLVDWEVADLKVVVVVVVVVKLMSVFQAYKFAVILGMVCGLIAALTPVH